MIKKIGKFLHVLINLEGIGAKSYIKKGFLIYEKMLPYLVIC